ncbi:MAG: helix-turn-helix domain-containing protein [Paracoccaceae bacterium]
MMDWYGPDMATFGDRVAAAREAAGMTQQQLARRLGIKLKTLQGWENDASEPRANKLSMAAGMLNVSIMWLLNGEGNGLPAPEEAPETPSDLAGLMMELRDIRTHMRTQTDRLARLEKALARRLREPAE